MRLITFFYRQFGAVKEGESVTFSVGFAEKILRQTSSSASSTAPKPSTSALASSNTSGAITRMAVHSLPALGMAIVLIVSSILL